jgi:hypothetical protein
LAAARFLLVFITLILQPCGEDGRTLATCRFTEDGVPLDTGRRLPKFNAADSVRGTIFPTYPSLPVQLLWGKIWLVNLLCHGYEHILIPIRQLSRQYCSLLYSISIVQASTAAPGQSLQETPLAGLFAPLFPSPLERSHLRLFASLMPDLFPLLAFQYYMD